MSTAAPLTEPDAVTFPPDPPPGSAEELAAFHEWLGEAVEKPLADFPVTLQNCVEEFSLWREERDRLREELRPELEAIGRGEVGDPIDWDALGRRLRERWTATGIPE